MGCHRLYEPINTLKAVAPEVWVVDGPEIAMDYALGLKVPFPTRATIVRLADGGLWVHSPTPLPPQLERELAGLGSVRWLIAPNTIHFWWVADWKARFPQARTYAAPGVRERAGGRFTDWDEELGDVAPEPWRGTIGQALAPGSVVSEVVFHHAPSRTLILTDLIENFEAERVTCLGWRLMMRAAGCLDPNGAAPYDLRMTFRGHRDKLRATVRQALDWSPRRVLLAHGRWYEHDAPAELARAFRWVLKS